MSDMKESYYVFSDDEMTASSIYETLLSEPYFVHLGWRYNIVIELIYCVFNVEAEDFATRMSLMFSDEFFNEEMLASFIWKILLSEQYFVHFGWRYNCSIELRILRFFKWQQRIMSDILSDYYFFIFFFRWWNYSFIYLVLLFPRLGTLHFYSFIRGNFSVFYAMIRCWCTFFIVISKFRLLHKRFFTLCDVITLASS